MGEVQPVTISGQPGKNRSRQKPDSCVANRTSGLGDYLGGSSEDQALTVARRDCPGERASDRATTVAKLLQRRHAPPREGSCGMLRAPSLSPLWRRQNPQGRVGQMPLGSSPA